MNLARMAALGTAFALLRMSGLAQAQTGVSSSIIFENYVWTRPSIAGAANRLSWIYGETRLSDKVKVVGSFLSIPIPGQTLNLLDEGFLEVRSKDKIMRLGRLRIRFGFDDWSELFYTPIAQLPMSRNYPVSSLSLLRFDTGFDVQGGTPQLTYQVSMVDVSNDSWQLVPKKLDHTSLRLQTSVGDWILGADVLSRIDGGNQKNTMAGIDVRWTAPSMTLRAELVKGFDIGQNAEGGFVDFFYRPEKMHRTQFGSRAELYRQMGGETSQLYTLGFRHILAPELALTVNYGMGNGGAIASRMTGWTVQLMTAVRF